MEEQVKLLRNEVPGAFFQLAKVSKLKQQIVEAEKHPWRGMLRNKHTKATEEFIFYFHRIGICWPLRGYSMLRKKKSIFKIVAFHYRPG